jgi:hypothetical protein
MIVVCKKYRLIEHENGKFKNNTFRKLLRKSVKIDKNEAEAYSKIFEKTGIIYEVDEEATKVRNESLILKAEQDNPNSDAPEYDRDLLKKEADLLGLEYQKNIKNPALFKLIEDAKQNK